MEDSEVNGTVAQEPRQPKGCFLWGRQAAGWVKGGVVGFTGGLKDPGIYRDPKFRV